MISETRNRSSRYILIGLLVAIVSAILVANTIGNIRASVVPPPTPTPEPLSAILYAVNDIGSQQGIGDLIFAAPATDAQSTEIQPTDESTTPPEVVSVCPPDILLASPIVGSLQVCMIPSRFAPPTAIRLDNFLSEINIVDEASVRSAIQQTLGTKYTQVNIPRGTVIQEDFLDTNPIPEGFIEVSLGVNAVTSVGGRVRPGQRVDVVVSYERGDATNKTSITEVLLQNVEVIAVSSGNQQLETLAPEQFVDPASGAAFELFDAQRPTLNTTVVLALQPQDARDLVYMTNFAKEVRLLIRRPGDNTIYNIAPVTLIE